MENTSNNRLAMRTALFGIAILSIVGMTGCGEPLSFVVLDNGTTSPMRISVDQDTTELEPNTHKIIRVSSGTHKFLVESDGSTIFDGTKEIAASSWTGKMYWYLFNPDFTNRYATFDIEYRSDLTRLMDETVAAREDADDDFDVVTEFKKLRTEAEALPMSPWMELPSGIDYFFSEAPDEIQMRGNSEVRTCLVRATKEQHAIIKSAVAVDSPTEEDYDKLYDAVDQLWYYPTRPTSVETIQADVEDIH